MIYAELEELITARLHLRKIRRSDVQAYYERLGRDAEVTRFMLFRPHEDISDAQASVEKTLGRYEAGRGYRWAITRKGEKALIGVIDLLSFDEKQSSCSFAYMLGKDFWGMGYGTECVEAVFAFAFSRMEIRRIEADHFAPNEASGAVMRKVGMVYQGTVPGKYRKDGIDYDAPQYAITRQQWADRKNR